MLRQVNWSLMNFALMTIVDPALSNAPVDWGHSALWHRALRREGRCGIFIVIYIFDLELNGELVNFSWLVDEGWETWSYNKRTLFTIQCIFEMKLVLPDSSLSSGCLALRAFVVVMIWRGLYYECEENRSGQSIPNTGVSLFISRG